jgi:DNA-binding transcriptional ArsR family regulator
MLSGEAMALPFSNGASMSADPNIAQVALLIGEPARATMLVALLGGEALPAGELAARARISAPTASAHLAKLVAGGLIQATTSGRHRYYRLSSPLVGSVLESLASIAPARPVISLRQSEEARALRFARTCYDHLAGALGVALMRQLLTQGLLREEGCNYTVSDAGQRWLDRWDIDAGRLRRSRRAFAKPCLDWSERHNHLAGALGAAITLRLFERGWLRRIPAGRAVQLTAAGKAGLHQELGLVVDAVDAIDTISSNV